MAIDESWYRRPEGVAARALAGGVVVRVADEQVFVALAREGDHPEYVLPKGRVEPGETPEEAARREIGEETGLTDLTLVGPLGVRERLNFERDWWNVTHYFLFTTDQTEAVPQDRAHHASFGWFPIDALPPMFWPEQRKLLMTEAPTIRAILLPKRLEGEDTMG